MAKENDQRGSFMGDESTRRDFLSYLMGAGITTCLGVGGYFAFNFVVPQKNSIKYVDVLITNSKQLPEGSHFKFRDFKGKAVLLVNRKGEIRAFSSVCPHLGCDVKWESDRDRFLCPCHIGIFDPNGSVVSGPPSKKLTEFAVKVENGNIYVSLVEA